MTSTPRTVMAMEDVADQWVGGVRAMPPVARQVAPADVPPSQPCSSTVPESDVDELIREYMEFIGRDRIESAASKAGEQRPSPEVVPAELAGRWIAWSKDFMRIVGVGDSPLDAINNASEAAGLTGFVPHLSGRPMVDGS